MKSGAHQGHSSNLPMSWLLIFLSPLLLPMLTLLLSACAQHPESHLSSRRANLEIPERYDGSNPPTPQIAKNLLELFEDKQLKSFINRALEQNPSLNQAASSLEESGFNLRSTRAGLLPFINANASAERRQFANLGFGPNTLSIPPNNAFISNLDVTWELDVWGRIRAGVTAAAADQTAAAADYAAARQSIAAQIMQSYMEVAGAEQRLAITDQRLSSFATTLAAAERRFEAGTADLSEIDLARTDLENARAELAERRDSRAQAVRQLRSLAGQYPSDQLGKIRLPALARGIPSGLPSDLLMNRPDIDAAYQRLRAADQRVTVAHRDLFPSFTLTGRGGRSAPFLEELSNSSFNTWSILGGLTAPVFDAGRLKAELSAADKRAEQAYFAYQAIVLNALREVEDALGSEQALAQRETAIRSALNSARSAEDRTRSNYEAGLTDLVLLLEAQRRRFLAEDALINLQVLRRQNRIALALALGKGV